MMASQPSKVRNIVRKYKEEGSQGDKDKDATQAGRKSKGSQSRYKQGAGFYGKTIAGMRKSSKAESRKHLSRQHLDKNSCAVNVKHYKILIVKNIPIDYNTRPIIYSHFCKFGEIKKMYNSPNNLSATIHFETHTGAANAKKKGSILNEGGNSVCLNIFWKRQAEASAYPSGKQSSPTHSESSSMGLHTTVSNPWKFSSVQGHSEVDDELLALQGSAGDFSSEEGVPLERPRKLKKTQEHVHGMGQRAPSDGIKKYIVENIVASSSGAFSTQLDTKTNKPIVLFGKSVSRSNVRKVKKPESNSKQVNSPTDLTIDDGDSNKEQTSIGEPIGSSTDVHEKKIPFHNVLGVTDQPPARSSLGTLEKASTQSKSTESDLLSSSEFEKSTLVPSTGSDSVPLFGNVQAKYTSKSGCLSETSQAQTTRTLDTKPAVLLGKPTLECASGLFGKPKSATETVSKPVTELFSKPVSEGEHHQSSGLVKQTRTEPYNKPAYLKITSAGQSMFGNPSTNSTSHFIDQLILPSDSSLAPVEQPTVVCKSDIFSTAKIALSRSEVSVGKSTVFGSRLGRERDRSASPADRRSRSPVPTKTINSAPIKPKQRPQSPKPQVVHKGSSNQDRGVHRDLQALKERIPQNISEQIEILNTRDAILHQVRKKKQGKHTGVHVTHGICQDMCPEKERLVREEQRRLHVYELKPSNERHPKVDHARAVKEYSRSSADQEFPLPHELRSYTVLQVTMNYLLDEIADRGQDGEWGEWYDFLWSRTRGIRKDITQQRLCNVESVELIEKCARFHIYSAQRLCEEDMSVFDMKINNENLTKCLQSLKEMYHDLRVKQNTHCQNEAEFRAYMVLMNLNQGDILREVQQLDDTIRRTPELHFVVGVYSALNSNNYVRFFKLVRKATFLNACIMHRYFNQVRVKALQAIIRSHSVPGGGKYPLGQLAALVGFENEDQVADFCDHHEVVVDSGGVILEKTKQVIMPESVCPPKRALTLIENKVSAKIGEIINGGTLDMYELPHPSTSFDSQGRFKGVDLDVEIPAEEEAEPHEQFRKTFLFTNEAVKQEAKEIFLEVIDEMANEMAGNLVDVMQVITKGAPLVTEEIIAEQIESMAGELSGDIFTTMMKEKRYKEGIEIAKQKNIDAIVEDIINEGCNCLIHEISTLEKQEIQARLKKESMERMSHHIASKLLENVLNELTQEVSDDVFETDVTQRVQHLEVAFNTVRLMRTVKWWKLWRDAVARSKRLEKGMQTFPAAPLMLHPALQLDRLLPGSHGFEDDKTQIINGGKLTLGGAPDVYAQHIALNRDIFLHRHLRKLKHDKAWMPLNFHKLLDKSFLQRKPKGAPEGRFLWKLLVSVEDISLTEDDTAMWLLRKLQKGKSLSSLDTQQAKVLTLYIGQDFGVCVRGLMGNVSVTNLQNGHLQGTSGLLFLVTRREMTDLSVVKMRLEKILSSLLPVPLIPVAVLVQSNTEPGRLNLSEVVDQLNLKIFKEQALLSDFILFDIGRDIEEPYASAEVSTAVTWLAKLCPVMPHIVSAPLNEVIENILSNAYYTRIYENVAERKKNGLLDLDPNILTSLYNSVIEFLSNEVLAAKELTKLSWPVTEFVNNIKELPRHDWNSEGSLADLQRTIENLLLPEFNHSDRLSENWQVADVWKYFERFFVPVNGTKHVALFTRVRCLLDKVQKKFENNCSYVNMPWIELIDACISYRLQQLPLGDQQIFVHYIVQKLNSYSPPAVWFESLQESQCTDATIVTSIKRASSKRRKVRHISRATPQKIQKKELKNALDILPVSASKIETSRNIHTLDSVIAEERRKAVEFEDYLRNQLNPCRSILSVPQQYSSIDEQHLQSQTSPDYKINAPSSWKYEKFQYDHAKKKATSVFDITDVVLENSVSHGLDALKYEAARVKQEDKLFEMRLDAVLTQTDLDSW